MFEIKTATRQGIKPLIGLFSESGCGKTMSSLLLARGFVGPAGKIVMLDTESGRGSLYADVIPGGYDVIEMREPFSPARYIEAIQLIEKSNAGVLVIDSASHEWEGIGGVLDMATENESRSGKTGLHNWKQPKMEHAKFMLKMLQSSLPIIVCLRAKFKTRQGKDERGKTQIIKDDHTTPIQADDFIFEMTAHGEILQNHSLHLTKCSHPSLRGCFPEGKPISIQNGELLAAWCSQAGSGEASGAGKAQSASPAKQNTSQGELGAKTVRELEIDLWTLLKPIRKAGSKEWGNSGALEWLYAKEVLDGANVDDVIPGLTAERLEKVIAKAREVLTR